MAQQTRPRVALIGTGGTISFVGRHNLDLVEYGDYGKLLQADELLARVPETAGVADVVPMRFRTLPSTAITPHDWLELNDFIHDIVGKDPSVDGIVVTHGTATLEETAYFLNLTLKVPQTVVLVGAQRPPSALSSDAHLNLLNAVRVASDPAARGLGVLVMLNDEIQAAREVTKGSTYRLETFRTPDIGMLGYADADGNVVIYRAPTRRHAPDTVFDVRGLKELPRVDITYSYAGAEGTAIDAFVAAGAKGIVTASLAPGKNTPGEDRAVAEACRKGVLVVQSCRAGSGRVILRTLQRNVGAIVADNLNPQKARILAMLVLTTAEHPAADVAQRCFDEY